MQQQEELLNQESTAMLITPVVQLILDKQIIGNLQYSLNQEATQLVMMLVTTMASEDHC